MYVINVNKYGLEFQFWTELPSDDPTLNKGKHLWADTQIMKIVPEYK